MRFKFLLLSVIAALVALLRPKRPFEPGDDWVPPPPPGKKWLMCVKGSGDRAIKTIGHDGDTITLNGHVLDVPKGAVPPNESFRFTLREAKTREVMVNVKAKRVKATSKFNGMVHLTLSYARCADGPTDGEKLDVWRHRSNDGLQPVGGNVDPQARTITVTNTKISRFTIAEGRH